MTELERGDAGLPGLCGNPFNLTQHIGGETMEQIPDDPIIRSMEDTGYPPWMR